MRRVRGFLRALCACLALSVVFSGAVALPSPARADAGTLSAVLLRNADTSQYFADGADGASVNVGVGTTTAGDVTTSVLEVNVSAPSLYTGPTSIDLSAGLAPGTYSTTNTVASGGTYLETSFEPCGQPQSGTLTVTEAQYDDSGAPTVFAASFTLQPCEGYGVMHGEIRWKSSEPLAVLQAPDLTSLNATVLVNSTADLPVTMTARGNSPVTPGAASIAQTPLSDGSTYWSVLDDGCAHQTLMPGDTCTVTVRFAPLRPNGTPVGTEYAAVVVPDGNADNLEAHISAKVAPLPGQVVGLTADGCWRTELPSSSAPPEEPPRSICPAWQTTTAHATSSPRASPVSPVRLRSPHRA